MYDESPDYEQYQDDLADFRESELAREYDDPDEDEVDDLYEDLGGEAELDEEEEVMWNEPYYTAPETPW